ncbi:MAG: metal ABC transporter solute-binding protein, Zn/Mn family [Chloroflexota bacterium]
MPEFLQWDFMQNAFLAGTIIAIVAACAGYFVILRHVTFAGHALSHIGFSGAAGAVVVGIDPLWGLLVFTLLAALAMGALGERLEGRDVAIGIVLAFALGLGILFLQLYTAYASEAFSILFGTIMGISRAAVLTIALIGLVVLAGLTVIFRPLLYMSVNPVAAEAGGVPVRLLSAIFLLLLALAVSEAVQVVGVLLIFALLIAPPATAMYVTARVYPALLIAIALGVLETWFGLIMAFYTNYSVSFFIASAAVAIYLLVRLMALAGVVGPGRSLRRLTALLAVLTAGISGCGASHSAGSSEITVVAAENEYGAMAQAIGGKDVRVTSLLTNPNTDPHEFEASASTAEAVARARLVIENGIGYDAWVGKLLSASPRSGRLVFDVGVTLEKHTGDNPHIWYDPAGWQKEATIIADDLSRLAPKDRAYFQQRKAAWLASLRFIHREIARVRQLTANSSVIATEPVYGYMLATLGATSQDAVFQKAIMNGTDPSPQSVSQFETDLHRHTVRMLFYNSQVVDPTTTRMRTIARQSGIPVVGVTETQPGSQSFVAWQIGQLQAIQRSWK